MPLYFGAIMSLQQIISYSDPLSFAFNDYDIEVSDNRAKLKDRFDFLGDERILGYTFTNSTPSFSDAPTSLIWRRAGSATKYTAQGLNLTQQITDLRVEIDGAGNLDQIKEQGCLLFRYTPNYSGSPNTKVGIFVSSDNDSFQIIKNSIVLEHKSSGDLNVRIKNNGNIDIVNEDLGNFSPVAGQTYQFQLNIRIGTGQSVLYIDGSQFGPTMTQIGTREPSQYHCFGSSDGGYTNCYVKDFIAFSTRKQIMPLNYTVPSTQYSTGNPILSVNTPILADKLTNFTDSALGEYPPSTEVKYILQISGEDMYHDGTEWTTSDLSYVQSNTPEEITANAATLPIGLGVLIYVKVLLHSGSGDATPSIAQTSITYDFSIPTYSVGICNVQGVIIAPSGKPIAGAKITLSQYDVFNGTSLVVGQSFVYTNKAGSFVLPAVETQTTSNLADITVEYTENNGNFTKVRKILYNNLTIPNQPSVNLSDII